MRYSVISLLLFNIAYLGWNLFGQNEQVIVSNTSVAINNRSSGEEIVLLSQLNSEQLQALQIRNLPTLDGNNTIVAAGKCFSIGDFPDLAEASQIRDVLVGQGLDSTLNLQEQLTNSSFLVYLPPYSPVGTALEGLETLAASAIEAGYDFDPRIIDGGELANAIAINAYETEAEAAETLTQLEALGYAAQINRAFEFDSIIKVVVRSNENPPFEAEIWPQIQNERPYLSRTENLCETIAQGGQFP